MKLVAVEYTFQQYAQPINPDQDPANQLLHVLKVEHMLPAVSPETVAIGVDRAKGHEFLGTTIRTSTGWTFNSENLEQLTQIVKGPQS